MSNPLAIYLRRFRRVVAPPGRPSPGAIPVDRLSEPRAEIADLLASIDRIADEGSAIEQRAQEQAERRERSVRAEAERLLAEAHDQAAEARRDAAATQQESVERELDELLAVARARAEAIGRTTTERLPAFIDRILATVLAAGSDAEGRTS